VTCYGRNTLYRNRRDGTFEDVTQRAQVGLVGFSTGATWFDYDNDGHLDLYVGQYADWNMKKDKACYASTGVRDVCSPQIYAPAPDVLYHNNGNGTFTDVTTKAGVKGPDRRALGVAAADLSGDGKLDLFVANDLDANSMFINRGNGKFEDMAMQSNVAFGINGRSQANMGLALGDYDEDGDLDTLVTTFAFQPYTLYRNDGNYSTDVSATTGCLQSDLTISRLWRRLSRCTKPRRTRFIFR
jgi:hypothetical protein